MQPRRHDDRTVPSDPRLKLRDREIELGHAHDPYAMPRRDFPRRSLSPRKEEKSKRLLGVDERNSSVERRDFGWDFGAGRGERVQSRSSPFGLMRERRDYDDGVFPSRDLPKAELRQRYEFVDRADLNAHANTGLKHERRQEARLIREKDFSGSRLSGQKFIGSEDLFRLPQDLGTTSKYGEGSGGFSSSLANMDINQFKDERARYPDPLLDKLSGMESYRGKEKPMFYSRDVAYHDVPVSQSKDYMGSSSGISRANFQGSYKDEMPLVTEYSGKSGKFMEPLGFSSYVKRSSLEYGRDPKMENDDLPRYWRDKFSPTGAERQDYFNPGPREEDSEIYGYPSDDLYRSMRSRERDDYDHKDLLRPVMRDPVVDSGYNGSYTSRNLKDRSFLDHPSIQKQKVLNYLDVSASKGGEYLDYGSAHDEYRSVSGDREMPHLGVTKGHKISHLRSDYGFGRNAIPPSHDERMRSSPEFEYEPGMRRLAGKSYEVQEEEHGIYDSSDRALKRKYNPDAEMSRHNSRRIMSEKWYSYGRVRDLDERNEEWSDQDSSLKFSSRRVGYDNKQYRREGRVFVGEDRHRYSESEDWLPSEDYMDHVQEQSVKPHKSGGKYLKGHLGRGPQSSHSSSRLDRRHVLSKPHNVWIRGQGNNQENKHENEVYESEDLMNSSKSEPHEGSEEFKQLVHDAFLRFSKKLNENPAVRKRYKEQGRAGSLFCIVCGKSISKEFMDTQRLATHAFMSHKFRLRADHLGLHKAICVLLGWKSVVAPDVTTWVPETIPHKEAMDQKEDLILWPPVVIIHNNSIEDNKVDEQKVSSLDAVEDYLRGKGFSGGKFKTCLGKPGNHGVIVVKFLGTFPCLQDAERLHNHFVENKCGRADFGQVGPISSKVKSSGSSSDEVAGHKNVELVLYGYMGISEDLDKVDLDTKRKCAIKSKKEIQDLENAPVKPE